MQALMFAPLGCVEAQWEAVGEILPWKKTKKLFETILRKPNSDADEGH